MKLSKIIAAAGAATFIDAAHLQIVVAPSTLTPSPSTQISHSTSAYLTKAGQTYAAPLSADGLFDFRNVSSGSYLVDIVSSDYLFAPLRIDIQDTAAGEVLKAWGTWRGNEWSNNGESYAIIDEEKGSKKIMIITAARKEVFVDRQGFSVMSILKNPMIMMAGAAALMMFGMPYLIDNMDDETRAEFEKNQAKGPMATLMGTSGSGQKKPDLDFDPAGWLAEKTAGGKKKSN